MQFSDSTDIQWTQKGVLYFKFNNRTAILNAITINYNVAFGIEPFPLQNAEHTKIITI